VHILIVVMALWDFVCVFDWSGNAALIHVSWWSIWCALKSTHTHTVHMVLWIFIL